MLTDAYGVGGWVGVRNINAYGCLRWIWVMGWEYPNAYGCFNDGGGWCVWFNFDQKQVQFLYRIEKQTCIKKDDINVTFMLL